MVYDIHLTYMDSCTKDTHIHLENISHATLAQKLEPQLYHETSDLFYKRRVQDTEEGPSSNSLTSHFQGSNSWGLYVV